MKILRWILFIPVAAIVAVAFGFTWSDIFTTASFSYRSLIYSVVGLSPLFFKRLLSVCLFVVLGALVAPGRGRKRIALLGVLGGIYGWPFGPMFEIGMAGPVYYAAEVAGAISGSALGMIIAFLLWPSKKEGEPNCSASTHCPHRAGI